MSHKHRKPSRLRESGKGREGQTPAKSTRPRLEIVLKGDTTGSVEGVSGGISEMVLPGVDISIIHSGIGAINRSDILMAETGSRLIVGFQVSVLQGIDRELMEHGVEVRLYKVIYTLTDDIKRIAESIIPHVPEENIIGSAKVIALFKSSRKGIIIGCKVLTGHLAIGQRFRIVSAMGPVYIDTIESLHIEKNVVQKAVPGQQVGIKIRGFKDVKTGDFVESFKPLRMKGIQAWKPRGEIIRISE
jgi:translation initiation factor IF-2